MSSSENTPQLTAEQRQAIQECSDGGPITLLDDVTNTAYVLLREDVYRRNRALFEENDFDVREANGLMDEVARAEGWDDPEMDAYNALDLRDPE